MILSRKIRIKPSKSQEIKLWKSVGVARWAYNWTLSKQEENQALGLKFIPDSILRKEITKLKQQEEYKWLKEVSNNVPKQAIKDACNAYMRFFKGVSNKPKFKTKKKSKSSFYNDNVKLKVNGKMVLIEKVGWIKTSEQIPDDVKYLNPRVSYDGKYWYLSVGVECEPVKQELTTEILGIDLGIKELAVCSNGKIFKSINKTKVVKRIEKRLRRLQRKSNRKYRANKTESQFVKSNNMVKNQRQMRKHYRRLTNIRTNYIHQITNEMVKAKPCKIVMEDLDVRGMMKNRHLAKDIMDQKMYEFIRQMKYKCERYGIEFIQVGRFFPSSKTCSSCGQIKSDLKLSDRVYKCDCGLELDRDLNAALNLAKYGEMIS